MFSLKLFGGVSIEDQNGQVRGRLSQKRRIALLALLALGRRRPVSRDKLLGLLWPESDEDRARHSLADAVYHIRRTLGDDALISAGDDLVLNAEIVASDVHAFEDALERGELESALAQYAGPLLDGFHLDNAPEFERWCDRERDRLARAREGALEQLARDSSARGDVDAAVHWCRLLAAANPYNSNFVMRLMEALDRAGDRAGAIQQGRIHAELMKHDIGADADADILAFIEQLRVSRPSRFDAVERTSVTASPSNDMGDVVQPSAPVQPRRRRVMIATAILVVLAASVSAALALRNTRDAHPINAIAVLPCANLTNNPAEDYFSDGLTEELIAALSHVRALRVVARTSVFAYKNQPRDIREVAKALNVGTVLECSFRRMDDRVRVTAQLITASDGFHLWSESYDREGADILSIQNDLAIRIVDALETRLTVRERGRLSRRPTSDQRAHALYLKGQYFFNQRTPASYRRAVEYFQHAIALDSQYARAYSGLARTYSLQALSGVYSSAEAGERMRSAAGRAIEIDPSLGEAHAAMGVYYNLYAWDSHAAEQSYRRAIELDPNYGDARHYYANMLRSMGRFAEALEQRQKAIEVDPLSGPVNMGLGRELIWHGKTNEGVRVLRDAIEMNARNWQAYAVLGNYYADINRLNEAIDSHRRAVARGGRDAEPGLARVLALAGKTDEAKAMLARFINDAENTGNYPPRVAPVFVALDDVAGALNWLERAYEYKHPQLRLLPLFAPSLVGDPHFLPLMQRIGLRP